MPGLLRPQRAHPQPVQTIMSAKAYNICDDVRRQKRIIYFGSRRATSYNICDDVCRRERIIYVGSRRQQRIIYVTTFVGENV